MVYLSVLGREDDGGGYGEDVLRCREDDGRILGIMVIISPIIPNLLSAASYSTRDTGTSMRVYSLNVSRIISLASW